MKNYTRTSDEYMLPPEEFTDENCFNMLGITKERYTQEYNSYHEFCHWLSDSPSNHAFNIKQRGLKSDTPPRITKIFNDFLRLYEDEYGADYWETATAPTGF
ncbi:MAG: hypothetical protein FWG64_01445 [Firmicutes bacterium]|nr:hypothetical protein [Bacillota bacterium]